MKPVLYQFASSPFTEKVRRALNYKGIVFDVHEVERAAIATGKYAQISPSGKFPALELDGTVVRDSTDILEALDRAFPQRPILPADPLERAMAHVFEDWADESLYFYEMTVRLAWEHNLDQALDGFAKGLPHLPKDILRKAILDGVTQVVTAQGLGRKPREVIIEDLRRHFQRLEAILGTREWLAASHPSNADVAVAAQINAILFAREGRDIIAGCPAVSSWLRRMDAHAPATQPGE